MTLVSTLELCDQKFLIACCSMTAYPITLKLTQRAGMQFKNMLQYNSFSVIEAMKMKPCWNESWRNHVNAYRGSSSGIYILVHILSQRKLWRMALMKVVYWTKTENLWTAQCYVKCSRMSVLKIAHMHITSWLFTCSMHQAMQLFNFTSPLSFGSSCRSAAYWAHKGNLTLS